MKEFVLIAVSFALSSIAVFVAFVNDYNCKELKKKKPEKETENYPGEWGFYRQPLMLQPSMKPIFEHVGYFKLTKHLGLIHEQLGKGGGERGILCNETGKQCSSECARKHIYTSHDGKPLFFCRCFYIVMLGSKIIDETKSSFAMPDDLREPLKHAFSNKRNTNQTEEDICHE